MAKIKHNDPCHCGSGKKYRNCHLRADRAKREGPGAHPIRSAAPPPSRAPPWLRSAAAFVAVVGLAGAVAVGVALDKQAGFALAIFTGIVIAGLAIFGDPPPPKEDAGDPAGINFGR